VLKASCLAIGCLFLLLNEKEEHNTDHRFYEYCVAWCDGYAVLLHT